MIRVLVADDQALVRAGFVALLEATDGLRVVGEASDGLEVLELARQQSPDVVLMDIRMPRLDGISATRRLLAAGEPTDREPPVVLVLTTFDTDDNVFDALEAGAVGFLVKDTPPVQPIAAVRAAVDGGAVISPVTTRRLVSRLVSRRPTTTDTATLAALDRLTAREREVLVLIARGRSNREISNSLVISELTAKTHVSRVLAKLGVDSRVQAAVLAYETGLVRPGEPPPTMYAD